MKHSDSKAHTFSTVQWSFSKAKILCLKFHPFLTWEGFSELFLSSQVCLVSFPPLDSSPKYWHMPPPSKLSVYSLGFANSIVTQAWIGILVEDKVRKVVDRGQIEKKIRLLSSLLLLSRPEMVNRTFCMLGMFYIGFLLFLNQGNGVSFRNKQKN